MNNEQRRSKAIIEACEGGKFALGTSRKPVFGEPIRGIWAGRDNPIRDGFYVETIRRAGRTNRATFYRLTDGKGKFWEYWAEDTVFLASNSCDNCKRYENGKGKAFYTACSRCSRNWDYSDNWQPADSKECEEAGKAG